MSCRAEFKNLTNVTTNGDTALLNISSLASDIEDMVLIMALFLMDLPYSSSTNF